MKHINLSYDIDDVNHGNHASDFNYQGLTRQACLALCQQQQKMVIHFAHWLAIVEEGVVLVFRHQICTDIKRIAF